MENGYTGNLYSTPEPSYYKGKNMIAVMSGRHGSGKTWLAVSLAQVLSAMKQKVLLFDGSGGINNIKKQLGLDDCPDLDKVIYQGDCLNQIITCYNKGHFDLILSNPSSSGLATMSIGCLQIFGDDLNIISQEYDKVILDIDVNDNDAAHVLAGMSKSVIVVCGNSVASMTESYQIIRDFYTRYPQTDIKVLINQADNYTEGQRTFAGLASTCQRFLNYTPKLLGIVREDTRVRDAIRNQTTVINRYPQSEASLDVIAVAKEILK